MTRRKKPRHDEGLAEILRDALEKAEFEADLHEVLSDPNTNPHANALLREVVWSSPVCFDRAVEIIAASPLMQALRMIGPGLMTQGGPNPTVTDQATIIELYKLVHPETRERADMTRLIEAAKMDTLAFDTCQALWQTDQRRKGMPNWQLRQWRAAEPSRPPAKTRGNPKFVWRDAALTLLVADAVTLGFDPYKNSATDGSRQSACDVVSDALDGAGLPVPTISVLEQIWKKNRHRIPWLSSERSC